MSNDEHLGFVAATTEESDENKKTNLACFTKCISRNILVIYSIYFFGRDI